MFRGVEQYRNKFCNVFNKKRDEQSLSTNKLASLSQISAVYLGEIIKRKKSPPDKKIQYSLAHALKLTDEEKIVFFDLAANEREELPIDVYDFVFRNSKLISEIRLSKNKRWGEVLNIINPISKSIEAKSHTAQYKMHKYFARRPYNVFSNLIHHYSNEGDVILDCFCGGGVTVFEAAALNRKVIGVDLNPLATFITRMQMYNGDIEKLEELYNTFILKLKEKYSHWYDVQFDDDKGTSEWVEWVYSVNCPHCKELIILTDQNKIKNGIFECRSAGCKGNLGVKRVDCSPNGKLALRTKYFSSISKSIVVRNIESETQIDNKIDYEKMISNLKHVPSFKVPLNWDRQHEDKLFERGITEYRHFFTARNFALNSVIFNEIIHLKDNIPFDMYEMLYFLFSSTLRYTNNMTRVTDNWEGGNPTSMDKHAFWMPNQFVETNILEIFEKRAKSIINGVRYSKEKLTGNCREAKDYNDLKNNANFLVLNRSSSDIPIPDNSVDTIITDPPYGSNVQYAELSTIWNAWYDMFKGLGGFIFNKDEAVVNRKIKIKGAKTERDYEELLFNVYTECYRVLKPGGYMVFTFNNKNIKVWIAMMKAVARAGFYLPSNGVIYQDFIKSYKNTSHLRFAGNIHGDFIYSFIKGENPNSQTISNNKLSEIIDGNIIESIHYLFSIKDQYTTTEIYEYVFLKLVSTLMCYISMNLDNEDLFSEMELFSDDYIDNQLKKHLKYSNEVWIRTRG